MRLRDDRGPLCALCDTRAMPLRSVKMEEIGVAVLWLQERHGISPKVAQKLAKLLESAGRFDCRRKLCNAHHFGEVVVSSKKATKCVFHWKISSSMTTEHQPLRFQWMPISTLGGKVLPVDDHVDIPKEPVPKDSQGQPYYYETRFKTVRSYMLFRLGEPCKGGSCQMSASDNKKDGEVAYLQDVIQVLPKAFVEVKVPAKVIWRNPQGLSVCLHIDLPIDMSKEVRACLPNSVFPMNRMTTSRDLVHAMSMYNELDDIHCLRVATAREAGCD